MTLSARLLTTLALVSLTFGTSQSFAAANNGGSQPSVGDVCLIGFEVCATGCDAEFPDSGLDFNEYISNQLCKRQCVDELNACTATGGSGSPARKQSVRRLVESFDFKGNGTPNDASQVPSGTTDQPGGNSNDGGKPLDGSGFNPGAVFSGPATVLAIQ
jgi:hypothetical protein